MAIISDFQEEEQTTKQSPSSSQPKPKSIPFTSTFDPSNPAAFLEKVFDFIANESDFFEKESAEKVILNGARAVRVKKAKAVAAEKAKIAAEAKAKAEKAAAAEKKDKGVEAKEDGKKEGAGKIFSVIFFYFNFILFFALIYLLSQLCLVDNTCLMILILESRMLIRV